MTETTGLLRTVYPPAQGRMAGLDSNYIPVEFPATSLGPTNTSGIVYGGSPGCHLDHPEYFGNITAVSYSSDLMLTGDWWAANDSWGVKITRPFVVCEDNKLYARLDDNAVYRYNSTATMSSRFNREHAFTKVSATLGANTNSLGLSLSEEDFTQLTWYEVKRKELPADPFEANTEEATPGVTEPFTREEGEQDLSKFGIHAEHVRGFASSAVKPTEFKEGEYFFAVAESPSTVFLVNHAGRVLRQFHSRIPGSDTGVWGMDTMSVGELSADGLTVVKIAPKETEKANDDVQEDRARLFRQKIREFNTHWEGLGDALNELADDADWCSEYEDVVRPLGMEGRESNEQRDYEVTVSVQGSFEWDSPSSRLDMAIEDYLDGTMANVSTSNIRVHGSFAVVVRIEEVSEGDAGSDYFLERVTNEMIVDAMESEGFIDCEADDFNITSWDLLDN